MSSPIMTARVGPAPIRSAELALARSAGSRQAGYRMHVTSLQPIRAVQHSVLKLAAFSGAIVVGALKMTHLQSYKLAVLAVVLCLAAPVQSAGRAMLVEWA